MPLVITFVPEPEMVMPMNQLFEQNVGYAVLEAASRVSGTDLT